MITEAEKLGIENASIRRQEIYFAILKNLQKKEKNYWGWSFTITPRWIWFPASNGIELFLPGADDIYVSPSQIEDLASELVILLRDQ